MTRYTLTVPVQLNDGTPVAIWQLQYIEHELLYVAGGFTVTLGRGTWQNDDGQIFLDPVRIYAMDSDDINAGTALQGVARLVATALSQEAVYLTQQPIHVQLVTPAPAPGALG